METEKFSLFPKYSLSFFPSSLFRMLCYVIVYLFFFVLTFNHLLSNNLHHFVNLSLIRPYLAFNDVLHFLNYHPSKALL